MSDLPPGWCIVPILELADLLRGVTYSKADASETPFSGAISVLRANNIQDRRFDLRDLVYVPASLVSQQQRIMAGDIVVATSSGSISVVGKASQAMSNLDAGFGAFCGLLRPVPGVNARYYGHFFSSDAYRQAVSSMARGVNINNLKRDHFASLAIPLPPINEQKRIADKLDALLSRVDACRERLDRVPAILKRFRQSILAAACSGQLTADWREENEDVEPVTDLIDRILTARRQRADELNRQFLSKGKKPPKKRTNLSRQPIEADSQPDIPDSWQWVTWNDLADWITYGFTRPMPHVSDGIPVVTAKTVRDGYFDYTDIDRTTPEAFAELSEKDKPRRGEILITKDGAIRGRAALVETDEPFCISQAVAVIRFGGLTAEPPYLLRVIQSRFTQKLIEAESSGTAIPHISITNFGRFPVPLPPLAEQHEIIRRVEQLFAFADALEARVATAQDQVNRLTPSLLAKAFRGELVPQDPNDEPATELLKRIQATRLTAPAKPKRGKQ
ncbi:MAG TPA: restriction endonuclease subunit S [Planctomycetaceae bacterium]|nr:restriction endonuclease subunit S [Planctomycetaceae bacterium]